MMLFFYNIPSYASYVASRAGRRGGGVIILIKSIFRPKLVFVSEPICALEYVIIKIFAASKFIAVLVYRPLDSTSDDLNLFLDIIASQDNKAKTILKGDLNLSNICWPSAALNKLDNT